MAIKAIDNGFNRGLLRFRHLEKKYSKNLLLKTKNISILRVLPVLGSARLHRNKYQPTCLYIASLQSSSYIDYCVQ